MLGWCGCASAGLAQEGSDGISCGSDTSCVVGTSAAGLVSLLVRCSPDVSSALTKLYQVRGGSLNGLAMCLTCGVGSPLVCIGSRCQGACLLDALIFIGSTG
jgi:hypothetical protein